MNIECVPDGVPVAKVVAMLADLGIDMYEVTPEGVHFGFDSIAATVYARHPEHGNRYVERSTGEAAVHHIAIPYTEKPNRP